MSAGVTEFPCTFPGPWIGKTFDVTVSGSNVFNWKFNTDCQTSIRTYPNGSSETLLCHQITQIFLVVRSQGTDEFACFPVSYNPEDNPLKFAFGLSVPTTFDNHTGEFTDICEICKKPAYAAESEAFFADSLNCDIPPMCPSPGIKCSSSSNIASLCPSSDIQCRIPVNGCPFPTTKTTTTTTHEPITTTAPELTTTTPEPTIATAETTTTSEPTIATAETTTTPESTIATSETTTTPEPKKTTHGHRGHCRKRDHQHP
ncbi:Hypothetical predicted protein [Mytilus galloprovincialis]|uniref:Uncharacterized protein n=1 Tax=Mytilus galloprovincialis TaxID=29158 RepID=A0A8B6GP55_MYTGA|nr:Hypothetical predicted protein [Mytilus galloprovincialis]